jgi:hypothetical protein
VVKGQDKLWQQQQPPWRAAANSFLGMVSCHFSCWVPTSSVKHTTRGNKTLREHVLAWLLLHFFLCLLLHPLQRTKEGRSCRKCVGRDVFESNQLYKNRIAIVYALLLVTTVLSSCYTVSWHIISGFTIAPNDI